MLASNGYFPLIILPTRVTAVSSTVINHLIANDHKSTNTPDIIKTDLTEHYPKFCFIDAVTSSNKTNQMVFRRDFLNFKADDFCDGLHNALATFFHRNQDINDNNFNNLFWGLIEIVKSKIDIHAPLKKLSRKQHKLKRKP